MAQGRIELPTTAFSGGRGEKEKSCNSSGVRYLRAPGNTAFQGISCPTPLRVPSRAVARHRILSN